MSVCERALPLLVVVELAAESGFGHFPELADGEVEGIPWLIYIRV